MIWMFSNDAYGRPILAAARRTAQAHHLAVTVVLSTRKLRRDNWMARTLARLRWTAKRAAFLSELAMDRTVRLRLVTDVNDRSFTDAIQPEDIGIVCGFDQIFGESTLRRFREIVNVHPSLLPRYRGPVPSHWVIANNERWTGFTVHRMTPRLDDGPILFQQLVEVPPGITDRALDRQIAEAAGPVVGQFIEAAVSGQTWQPIHVDVDAVVREGRAYQGRP